MKSFYCKQPYADEQVRAIIEGRKTLLVDPIDPKLIDDHNWLKGASNHVVHATDKCKFKVGERYWLKEAYTTNCDHYVYRATHGDGHRYKPPQLMPECASRFTMEVTRVYVKRHEGFDSQSAKEFGFNYPFSADNAFQKMFGVNAFFKMPWCWFVEFKGV